MTPDFGITTMLTKPSHLLILLVLLAGSFLTSSVPAQRPAPEWLPDRRLFAARGDYRRQRRARRGYHRAE